MLRRAKEITRAAGLQIILRHGEAVRRAAQELQPLAHRVVAVVGNQNAAGIRRAAPHAPAQLVQCRQAEPLGILNDHDRRVRHVNADLDDCRRDKNVQLTGLESLHDIVLFLWLQLAVQQADAPVGQQCAGGLGVVGRDGLQIAHGFVFLDGRADDVDLMPRRDLLVQKAVHVAALFAACTKAAALSVEVTDEKAEFARLFGENIGICFQIKDDIFDYFESKEIGKPTGNDMLEGKLTLPALYVLNTTTDAWAQEMALRVKAGTATVDEITRLIEFIKQNGGIEYAVKVMYEYKERALDLLRTLPDSAVKTSLITYLDYVVDRDK